MRIVQAISGYGINGAICQCLLLAESLVRRGHEVTVLGRANSFAHEECHAKNIPFKATSFKRTYSELRHISQWMRQQSVDVFHGHNSSAQIFGICLKVFARTVVVATAHQTKMHFYWMLSDFVIANSEYTRRTAIRWNRIRPSRIETVRCLINDWPEPDDPVGQRKTNRAKFGYDESDQVIGIVGEISRRKNHRMLALALPKVLQAIPTAKVLVAGLPNPAYFAQLQSELKRLGIEHVFNFASLIRDIPNLMRSLDLLVACPRQEPFGLTAPEAMAAGIPVVATNVGGLRESVAHGETGMLVPLDDVDKLASEIIRILSNRQLGRKMGAAGRERFLETFDNERNVARHEEIYRQVAPRALPAARNIQSAFLRDVA